MGKNKFDFEVPLETTTLREGTGISNLDGRLWEEMGKTVGSFFGDEAMVRARVAIEARYLIALSGVGVIRKLTKNEKETLLSLHQKIDKRVYDELRKIEAEVRHDVMAMTAIIKKLLAKEKSLLDIINHGWVHWGLTSEDVDNLARTTLLSSYLKNIYLPQSLKVLEAIVFLADKTRKVIIPAKTHLQPAIPTSLGKEIALFGLRLGEILTEIKKTPLRGKLTGAVGTMAAQRYSRPKINWKKFSRLFVESLGLEASLYTTQIEGRKRLIELLQRISQLNNILVDLSQDMRIYIGLDWLVQEAKKEEFGSSAMPQKVNPIDFENAQGNALFSNWINDGLIRTLPVSWLQRDLVDKTILRNLGLPFGYSQIALISTIKGLTRVTPNIEQIEKELNKDWGIVAEGFQTYLRAQGKGEAYEILKELTRGKKMQRQDIQDWVKNLKISRVMKKELLNLTPQNYTGYAKENTTEAISEIRKTIKFLKR